MLSSNKSEMRQKKANTAPMKNGEASSSVNIEQANAGKSDIKGLKGVLLKEFKTFRESVDRQYCNLKDEITMQKQCVSEELHKIEDILSKQKTEIKKELANKIDQNDRKLNHVLKENTLFKNKNNCLKERLDRPELAQLNNNVIINRVPEQQWELYDVTKQWVYDTTAPSVSMSNDPEKIAQAKKVNIAFCSRIGQFRLNHC